MRLESSKTMKRVLLVPWSIAPSRAAMASRERRLRAARGEGGAAIRHDAPALDRRDDPQQIGDVDQRVAVDQHEIGLLAGFDGADLILPQRGACGTLAHDP